MGENFVDYLRSSLQQLNSHVRTSLPDGQTWNAENSIPLPSLLAALGGKPPADQTATSGLIDGFSKAEIDRFLANTFQRKLKPSESFGSSTDNVESTQVFEKILIAAAKSKGIKLEPEEANEIIRLLQTGEFFNDLQSSTAAIAYTIPGLPLAIIKDRKGIFSPKIVTAVLRDVIGIGSIFTSFHGIESILEDLQDGKLDHPPRIMTHTMKELYRKAPVRIGLQTVHQLYAKENRSIRLATILYARSNGVDLTNEDIALALGSILSPDNPDLGPALTRAYDIFQQKNKGDSFLRLLSAP